MNAIKVIRRAIFLIASLYVYNSLEAQQKDQVIQALIRAHTVAFAKDNLLTQAIGPSEVKEWQDMIAGISQYIMKTAFDAKSTKTKEYFNQFRSIKMIAEELLKLLAENYKKNIEPTLIANKEKGFPINKEMINFIKGTIKKESAQGKELANQRNSIMENINRAKMLKFLQTKNNDLARKIEVLNKKNTELLDLENSILAEEFQAEGKEQDILFVLLQLTNFVKATLEKVITNDYKNLKIFFGVK
jgi:hypothetical protein